MNRRNLLATAGLVSTGAILGDVPGASSAEPTRGGLARTRAVAQAATAFLALSDDAYRKAVQHAFALPGVATAAYFKGGMRGDVDMVGERCGEAVWSNLPVNNVPRPGLRMGVLTSVQRNAAF